MDRKLHTILIFAASTLMLAAATLVILRPHLQEEPAKTGPDASETEIGDEEETSEETSEETASTSKSHSSRPEKKPAKTREERDKAKFDVGEMRNGAEDMLRRFRGTPEERQEVIDECKAGNELILAITDLAVAEYNDMSPEELRKAREEFEKDYRAQLDYLQTGRLHRMLKTQEEREIIGGAFDAVQQFLETLDNALHSAGY